MQTTRLQKQHRITRSSQPMGFDFLRAIWALFADNMGLECPKQSIINLSIAANREGKYYATIRQPRCRNGG